jgi:hypothetical protein
MARWLKPLVLSLLAALLAHAISLWLIYLHMPTAASTLEQRSDPLFTRTITAASAPEVQAAKPPAESDNPTESLRASSRSISTTVPATTSVALKPTPTQAQPATPTLPELSTLTASTSPEASITALASAATATTTTTTTAAETTPTAMMASETSTSSSTANFTSTQAISSQPAGNTDSLLITGQWPADTRVNYRLSGYYLGELHGNGRVQWTRSGESREKYQVRVEAGIPGLYKLTLSSQGRVSAQGLLPQAFEEVIERTGAQTRIRPLRLEEREVVLEKGTRLPRPSSEPMAVQDVVSQFIDLGHRFTQGRATLQEGQTVRIWLGRPGGLDEWTYDIGPQETLFLPKLGQVRVHALTPRPLAKPRGTITMQMWLAPTLQYLPAKIRISLDAQNYIELTAEQILQN